MKLKKSLFRIAFFILMFLHSNLGLSQELALIKDVKKLHNILNSNLTTKEIDSVCLKGIELTKDYRKSKKVAFYYYDFVLNKISNQDVEKDNYDLAIDLALNSVNELRKINFHERDSLLFEFQYNLAILYKMNYEFRKSKKILGAILKNKNNKKIEFVYSYFILSDLYTSVNEIDSSLFAIDSAIKYLNITEDSAYLSLAYNLKGNSYLVKKDFYMAYNFYLKSLAFSDKNDIAKSVLYSCISDVYNAVGDYDEAIRYSYLSLKEANKNNDIHNRYVAYDKIASTYMDKLKWNSALFYSKKMLSCSISAKTTRNTAYAYLKIGWAFTYLDKADSALYYLSKANEIYKTEKDMYSSYHIARINYLQAHIFFENKNYKKAKKTIENVLNFDFQKVSYPNALVSLKDAYELSSKIEYALGNYKLAIISLRESNSLVDSINFQLQQKKVLRFEFANKLRERIKNDSILKNKRETELRMLSKREKAKRKTILYWFLFVTFFLTVTSFGYVYFRKIKTQNKILSLQNKIIQTQVEPHFLANSLCIIQNKILDGSSLDAVDMISDFSMMTRFMLESSRESFINLKDELLFIEMYIKFQRRRDDKFDFELILDERINADRIMLPTLTTQPFIENAIEHGFDFSEKRRGRLSISYSMKSNYMEIIIRDNGNGISNENLEKYKSYSFSMIKERIVLFNKIHRGNDFSISIDSKRFTGTNVILNVPYKYHLI